MSGYEVQEPSDKKLFPVEIALKDGFTLRGSMPLPFNKNVYAELNSEKRFLEFLSAEGETVILAKDAIQSVRSMHLPKADHLGRSLKGLENFDPYKILRVSPNADHKIIRHSYLELVKLYHPDRFGGHDIPSEVSDYINAVSRRINMAYSSITNSQLSDSEVAS